MADVRALLRQQRTARRINHLHAVYSDTGKLSCAVCQEPIRTETAWGDHLRSVSHRQKMREQLNKTDGYGDGARTGDDNDDSNGDNVASVTPAAKVLETQTYKRRRSEAGDDGDVDMDGDDEDGRRKKRSRSVADLCVTGHAAPVGETVSRSLTDSRRASSVGDAAAAEVSTRPSSSARSTPQPTPPLVRQSSGTPLQGIEMSIPSRPATPIAHRDSFTSGNNSTSGNINGRNTVNGSGGLAPAAVASMAGPRSQTSPAPPPPPPPQPPLSSATETSRAMQPAPQANQQAEAIDEDEWTAFEAEVVNAPPVPPTARPDMNGGVVAAAAPTSAQDIDADGDQRMQRRAAEEAQLEDEKEEATRALEEEFEDMQQLESRVRHLKAKREALRSQPGLPTLVPPPPPSVFRSGTDTEASRRLSTTMIDKENIRQQLVTAQNGAVGKASSVGAVAEEDEGDEDEDEDEDDTDWDAFRFRV